MIDFTIIAILAAQPPPPSPNSGDDRRDASAEVSQAQALALTKQFTRTVRLTKL